MTIHDVEEPFVACYEPAAESSATRTGWLPLPGPLMAPVQGKLHRGSAKRLRRIKLRGNWSPELGLVVIGGVFLIGVLVWWL